MAIVIRNKLRNYILDVEDINERIMIITLRGKIDLHVFSAYAPTAAATYEEKESFHKILKENIRKRRKQCMIIIGANMNTKFLEGGINGDEGVGQHIF